MPAPLHEDARIYLRNQGQPITSANLNKAMETLRNDQSLRPSYSSETQMASNMGYSEEPDRSKIVPGQGRKFSELKGAGGFGVYDPDYEAPDRANSDKQGDRYYSSSSQMTSGPRQGQGGTAVDERGASPGSPSQSVSTESIKQTELDPPKAQAPDPTSTTRAEVNAVSTATPQRTNRPNRPPMTQPPEPVFRPGTGPDANATSNIVAATNDPNLNGGNTLPQFGARDDYQSSPNTDRLVPRQSTVAGGGINPAAAADNGSGVPPAAQVEPSPSWGDMYNTLTGWMPEGTGQRAQNVADMAVQYGGPIAMAIMAAKGLAGRGGGLTARPNAGRPPGAPMTTPPPGPIPGPPPYLSSARPPSSIPSMDQPTPQMLARAQPQLPPPAVDDINVWGPRRMADYGQVGQPTTAPVAAGPVQTVNPPVITPAAPPAQLALPAPAVQQAIGPALEAAVPKVARSAVTKAAPAAKATGKGRSGTARLPPTPGKGMTLEDAQASKGGGRPQPKKRGQARGRANQK